MFGCPMCDSNAFNGEACRAFEVALTWWERSIASGATDAIVMARSGIMKMAVNAMCYGQAEERGIEKESRRCRNRGCRAAHALAVGKTQGRSKVARQVFISIYRLSLSRKLLVCDSAGILRVAG